MSEVIEMVGFFRDTKNSGDNTDNATSYDAIGEPELSQRFLTANQQFVGKLSQGLTLAGGNLVSGADRAGEFHPNDTSSFTFGNK